MNLNCRRVEIITEGAWSRVDFQDIKAGNVFRLFEDTGEPVDNGQMCVALADAAMVPGANEGAMVPGVDCEPAGGPWDAMVFDGKVALASCTALYDALIPLRESIVDAANTDTEWEAVAKAMRWMK
jgi:hypothetical protein